MTSVSPANAHVITHSNASMVAQYPRIRFQAVIDWVDVRVTLAGPSQPRHVRNRIGRSLPQWGTPPYVNAITEDTSGTARIFDFRVQNPTSPLQFMLDIQSVRRPGDPELIEDDIQIIGIEVAFDGYTLTQDKAALATLTHHFVMHHARPPEGNARITEISHFRAAAAPRDNLNAILNGWSINAGAPDADYRARYYLKQHDTHFSHGAHAPLPLGQHRARMEITLQRSQLPFNTVDGWRKFKFESLARYFTLRQQTMPNSPLGVLMQREIACHGRPQVAGKQQGHRKSNRVWTKTDTCASEKIRGALRGLTRAQNGKRQRRCTAKTDDPMREFGHKSIEAQVVMPVTIDAIKPDPQRGNATSSIANNHRLRRIERRSPKYLNTAPLTQTHHPPIALRLP